MCDKPAMCVPTKCVPGTYVSCAGKKSCDACPKGRYCPTPMTTVLCPAGSYCPEGTSAPTPCPADKHCPRGSSVLYCPAGQHREAGNCV